MRRRGLEIDFSALTLEALRRAREEKRRASGLDPARPDPVRGTPHQGAAECERRRRQAALAAAKQRKGTT